MIAALIAKLTGRDGSRSALAGLAVAWGVSTLTGMAEARQSEIAELDVAITAARAELARLVEEIDQLLQTIADVRAQQAPMSTRPSPTEPGETVPAAEYDAQEDAAGTISKVEGPVQLQDKWTAADA